MISNYRSRLGIEAGVPQHTTEQRDFLDDHDGINPIIVNLLAMSSYDFRSDIRVTILGHIFEHSILEIEELLGNGASERKRDGIFYTPEYVTRFICRHTIIPCLSLSGGATTIEELIAEHGDDMVDLERRLEEIRILDPACGSGAFLIEAANTLRDIYGAVWDHKVQVGTVKSTGLTEIMEGKRNKRIVRDNIYGIDKNEQSTGLTMLSLFLLTASDVEKLPSLSDRIVVGNSVRPDGFSWDVAFKNVFKKRGGFDVIIGNPPYVRQEELRHKERLQMPEACNVAVPAGFSIPGQSDLSSYFYYHSICRLRPGGVMGFIASDAWMDKSYGRPLRQFLLDNADVATLLRTSFNVFNDAKVKTVVTVLKRGRGAGTVGLARVDEANEFQTGLFSYSRSVPQESLGIGNWNHHFMEPDEVPSGMVRMDKAGCVWRGLTTGNDNFFLLARKDLKKHGIDEKYVVPTMPDNMPSGLLAESDRTMYLLSVGESKGELARTTAGRRVLKYIETGEGMLIKPKKGADRTLRPLPELETIKSNDPWYSLKIHHNATVFLGRFIDKRPKAYESDGKFHAKDNFTCFSPNEPLHARAFLAFMSSTWFALQAERNGNRAGSGALQLLIGTCKALPVPDFGSMPAADVQDLVTAWLAYRNDLDQRKLDDAVFGVMGIVGPARAAIESEHREAVRIRMAAKTAPRRRRVISP